MALFTLDNWPLLFVCAALVVAAVIDGWKLKVPNWLTFPLVLSGWLLGICHDAGMLDGTGTGGFGASLAGTAVGFALLFPVYSIGGMGAGDVKMQMGFGAWIGAFYGYKDGLPIIWWASGFGAIICGVIALRMMLARGKWRQNFSDTRDILAARLRGAGRVGD